MRKFILAISVLFITFTSFAQSDNKTVASSSVNNSINTLNENFELYQTETIENLIKLNTRNGLMWQVKMNNEVNFETTLNTLSLVDQSKQMNGRFELKKTFNIYTFILLDKIDGRMWKVVWSEKPNERSVTPIESTSNSKL